MIPDLLKFRIRSHFECFMVHSHLSVKRYLVGARNSNMAGIKPMSLDEQRNFLDEYKDDAHLLRLVHADKPATNHMHEILDCITKQWKNECDTFFELWLRYLRTNDPMSDTEIISLAHVSEDIFQARRVIIGGVGEIMFCRSNVHHYSMYRAQLSESFRDKHTYLDFSE